MERSRSAQAEAGVTFGAVLFGSFELASPETNAPMFCPKLAISRKKIETLQCCGAFASQRDGKRNRIEKASASYSSVASPRS